MRKPGFIIGIVVLLMALMPLSMPVSDNLPAEAAKPPVPVPTEIPSVPPPQQPPPVIDGHGTGFIPPTMDLSYITGQRVSDGSLVGASPPVGQPPAFDWRNSSKVTSVKDQGNCGSCYAFASIGNVESRVLIDTNTTPPGPDYSENNAKECNWREINNWVDGGGNPWGSCDGGDYMILASLFSQKGVVDETNDPYVAANVTCNSSCPNNKTLLEWRIISTSSVPNTTVLKNYTMTYGPVYTSVYVDSSQGFNSSYNGSYTFNYTTPPGNGTNHAVLIVGWGDNLPPDQVTGLPGDGWIVKNSWGAGWGDNGYFYIHYGAANIGMWSSFMYDWQDYDNNGSIMYYDDDCWDNSWGYPPSTTAWGLCNFTPSNNTNATCVEFWTTDATSDIDIYIYDDFDTATTSLSNLLVSQLNYSFAEAGYHSVPLNSSLPLTAGDPVIVVVKFTAVSTQYPVPTDQNGLWETNRTHMSLDGTNGSWTDMGSYSNDDVAIRLRTSTFAPLVFNCTCGDICVNTTGWWRDGGTFNASATPIQSAVSNATGGETICVSNGTYHENVDVNTANLTIKSENGTANCVVNATNPDDHVFNVTASLVNITGFTVENATGTNEAGIYLANGVSHCNISSNDVASNNYGICLNSSSNNTLANNTANWNNDYGIYLYSSSNNTLANNTANWNNNRGIYLTSSSSNTIYNNYFHNMDNAYDNGNNTWNTTNTTGPNIAGGPYIGGNYWSDYTGNDTDGDGFGDAPYNITGDSNRDYLPLILTSATMEGHVSFPGRVPAPNNTWIEDFEVKLFEPGNLSHMLWTGNAPTNNTGVFNIPGLDPGTYDISIKNLTSLSEVNTSVILVAGNTTVVDFGTTREGDANNDDFITGADRSLLYSGWGKSVGEAGYNIHYDFNRDDWLTGADRSLMYAYWAQHGDLVS